MIGFQNDWIIIMIKPPVILSEAKNLYRDMVIFNKIKHHLPHNSVQSAVL